MRRLFHANPLPVALSRLDNGLYREINDAFCRLTGYSRPEVLGRTALELGLWADPDERQAVVTAFRRSGKVPENLRMRLKTRDGRVLPCLMSVALTEHEGVPHLLTAVRDIEELARTEERLRFSEERFREAFQTSPDAININRLEDGLFLDVNAGFSRLSGYARDEVIGRSSLEINLWADPADRQRLAAGLRERGRVDNLKARFRLKDGRLIVCLMSAVLLQLEGRPCILSITRDIDELEKAQQRIRESEERFRQMSQLLPQTIFEMDASGRLTFVNLNAFTNFGYSEEEFQRGLLAVDMVAPIDRERAALRLAQVLAGQAGHGAEYLMQTRNGRTFPGVIYSSPIVSEGQTVGLRGIIVDITEQRHAETALRNSEALLQSVLRAAPAGIGVVVDRVFTWVSAHLCEMVGYTHGELLGRNARLLYPDEAEFARVGQEKYAQIRARGIGTVETRWRCKNGSLVHVLLSSTPLDTENLGRGVVFTAVDITDHKQAEAALRANEERTRMLLDTMQQGVLELDIDGRILYSNPAAAAILECTEGELANRPIWELATQGDGREETQRLMERLLREQPDPYPMQTLRRRRDGSEAHIVIEWQFKRNSTGQVIGIVLLINDVSERVRLEDRLRQAQKIEAIGQLAGGVAHDFNNLLTPIIGYSELMRRATPASDPRHPQLGEVLQAAERARQLVQQLLAFGRKQLFEMKEIDLNETLRGFQRILRQAVREDVDLQIRPAAGLHAIRADQSQIEVILMNLAVNAQDAMPDGGLLVIETANVFLDEEYCQRHPPSRAGDYVMLAVSDTGAGMSAEVQRHLFEPFFTTKALGRGTGLGLATVYGITKQHNGYIWVYSEVGRGSTFKIYLPRVEPSGEEPRREPAPADTVHSGGETILVMEDNETVRGLVQTMLQQAGYRVLAPADVDECRRLFAADPLGIDLLLSDVVMPELSGPQLYRELGTRRPGLKTLYMSGYTDEIIAHHGILNDNTHFIQKPITYQALIAKVRAVLDGR